ncbi:LURP-one-related/scramblase family protein [Andreprevotia sp. IGB-42]|uniref:LURP-one-related/scramblase family protein n=1 Tax=Andreprevotia sp. IGB-42 TaxID=2497473 RepID=UPI00191C97BA|nr:phospholipid scramblase-related protein [Andreprevotia sp. IGB-42]
MFKAANNFDIYDPATNRIVLECREPDLGMVTKVFRFTDYKRHTPFDIRITTPTGGPVVRVQRGVSFFRSRIEVLDERDQLIGTFQQKLLSLGGKFEILDAKGNSLCWLKGKWTSWEFNFEKDGKQFASVSKKWAGIGKELFTSADNYMLSIDPTVPADSPLRQLIIAAVMCIDMVLKE